MFSPVLTTVVLKLDWHFPHFHNNYIISYLVQIYLFSTERLVPCSSQAQLAFSSFTKSFSLKITLSLGFFVTKKKRLTSLQSCPWSSIWSRSLCGRGHYGRDLYMVAVIFVGVTLVNFILVDVIMVS